MALWGEKEQAQTPVLDATFRQEKERLAALISAGATYAANSTATLDTEFENAQDHDWTNDQIAVAFTVGSVVAKTAAAKVEAAVSRLGLALTKLDASCCPDQKAPEVTLTPAPGTCECAKSARDA
jgi:hypothetical protein